MAGWGEDGLAQYQFMRRFRTEYTLNRFV